MINKRFSIGAENLLLDAFERGVTGMSEVRSAVLMLIAGILLGGPSRGSETASFPSDPILSQTVRSEKSPIILRHSPLPAQGDAFGIHALEDADQECARRDLSEGQRGKRLRPRHLACSTPGFSNVRTRISPGRHSATAALLIGSIFTVVGSLHLRG